MKKLLFDSDLLGDDLLTLVAICHSEAYKLEAITAYGRRIGGNRRAKIAQSVLHILGVHDVDIIPGASRPLIREPIPGCLYCDEVIDAFVDVQNGNQLPKLNEGIYAAQYLLEKAKANPGEFSLLCTGPLTNIAIACLLDRNFPQYLREVTIMGGCTPGKGNSNQYAESNIFNDPEAAHIFFNAFRNVRVIGLDVTLQVVVTPEDGKLFHSVPFFSDIINSCCNAHVAWGKGAIMPLHDILAFFAMEAPTLLEYQKCSISVEMKDDSKAGMFYIDELDSKNMGHQFATSVNIEQVLDRFRQIASLASR